MTLDPDAQAAVDLMAGAFPDGLHALPIADARAALEEGARLAPPGPDVHRVENRAITAEDHEIPVRIYWPTSKADAPALVWMHGGAFALGSLDGADATCRRLAVGSGAVVVSVDYRLAPEHRFPAGVEDAYDAAAWVSKNAAELGVDSGRVAIGGDSAGATLAGAVTLMARDRGGPDLAYQLLVYPTTLMRISSYEYAADPIVGSSMANFFWSEYVTSDSEYTNPYCAPMAADSLAGLPPAFVVVPEVDSTRADQEAYAHRLAASGVLTTCKVYPGAPHGFFEMVEGVAKARAAMADACRALRAHLSPVT